MDAGNERRQCSLASVVFTERCRKLEICFERKEGTREKLKQEEFPRGNLKDYNYQVEIV